MRLARASRLVLIGLNAFMPVMAGAQELFALAGATDTDDPTHATYGWQLQFQQPVLSHVEASLAWINEGHMPTHRRDGATAQAWLVSPPWHQRLSVGLGLGPYVYFDTEPDGDARGYGDHHGVGAILSAAMTLHTPGPWTFHLNINEIRPSGDVDTRSVMLGAGYHFGVPRRSSADVAGDDSSDTSADAGSDDRQGRSQALQVFGGQTTLNSLGVRKSDTYGLDYQASIWRWLDGAATWFHNTSGDYAPHDRLAAQLRVVHNLDGTRLQLAAGVGLFAEVGSADRNTTASNGRTEGLLLLKAGWRLSTHGSIEANWYRSFTTDDHDLDIIALGYAWHFGRR